MKKYEICGLDTIVAQKRIEMRRLPPRMITGDALRAAFEARGGQRDFMAALSRPASQGIALIAEIKQASPSAGVICHDFDPARIARAYESAGAQAVSVLTDERFFQGSLPHLKQVRQAVSLPLLRKDFLIDARQILEAIEWGADAVLLIAAILTDAQLRQFIGLANAAGLAALVEVHDAAELEHALRAGANLIGVNNRDLRTFVVDLQTTEKLAGVLRASPGGEQALLVAESGIRTRADVERLQRCGAQAILVGESLMKAENLQNKIHELVHGPSFDCATGRARHP